MIPRTLRSTVLAFAAMMLLGVGVGSAAIRPDAPFGERRDPEDWVGTVDSQGSFALGRDDPCTPGVNEDDPVPRGFTGHEMLDHLGLVHMNGRIYDPVLGRFLSPDPVLQAPWNLQNYNRYSYVLNNPLRYTDPTGYETVQDYSDERQRAIHSLGERRRAASGRGFFAALSFFFSSENWRLSSEINELNDAIAAIEETAAEMSDLAGSTVDPATLDDDSPEYQEIRRTLDVLSLWPGGHAAREFVKGETLKAAAHVGVEAAVVVGLRGFGKWATANPGVDGAVLRASAAESEGSNIVYRALNAGDAEALAAGRGLTARAPSGTLTAAEHVANVNPAGSPWISTTRNLDVARAYNGGNGMVRIDLSKVPSFQAEVWRTAPRVNGVQGLPYHRSFWAQEVTIFQEIPASAILGPVK